MSRDDLLDGNPGNAALSWGLLAVLAVSAVESVLGGDLLWAGFSAAVVAVALVPVAVARSPRVLVDWPILLLSALPAITRLLDVFVEPVAYVSIAALALLVVAELDAYSRVRMTPRFAAVMVSLTTLSVAGAWAVVQFAADQYLGTAFLTDVPALMWDLVAASAIGVAAGVAFEWYCSSERLSGVLDGGT